MAGLVPFNHRWSDMAPRSVFDMMDGFFNDSWPFGRNLMNDTFKIDVKETDTAYTIEAEMPGIKKEEISLSLNDDRLMICVQRNEEVKNDSESYIHRERRCSSMERSLYLADATGDNIDAALVDGVLKITVPKKTRADASRQIEIK